MHWYELAVNPQAVSQQYTHVPLLQHVNVKTVILSEDGPKIVLTLALASLPDKNLDNWKAEGCNAVHLQLDFEQLESIELTKWSPIHRADVKMEQTKNKSIEVQISSVSSSIEFVAQRMIIASLYCYMRNDY